MKAEEQVEILQAALVKYANKDNWDYYDWWHPTDFFLRKPEADQYKDDPGIVARTALEKAGLSTCEHDKRYSDIIIDMYPCYHYWKCKKCGVRGYDREPFGGNPPATKEI